MNILPMRTGFTSHVHRALPYFDVVTLGVTRKLEQHELDTIESLCGNVHQRRTRIDPWTTWRVTGSTAKVTHVLSLKQPTRKSIIFLQRLVRDGLQYVITEAEVSLDLVTRGRSYSELVHVGLHTSLFKRGRGRAKTVRVIESDNGMTTYYGPRGRPGQLVVYSGRRSKVTGEPCCHVEWRLVSTRSVSYAGIRSLDDLLAFSHGTFWRHKLPLFTLDMEALGKRLSGVHLNAKATITRSGKFPYNAYRSHGMIALRFYSILSGKDSGVCSLLEKLEMLGSHGVKAPNKLLRPIARNRLLPWGKGLDRAPTPSL